jgi:hypothetical protein
MHKERESHLSARVKFLEAYSNACDAISLPFVDCDYLFHEINLLSDPDLMTWIQCVDESYYPLQEWLESLVYFQKWLQENKKGKNFPDQVEYINCCIQGSANTGKLLPLIDLLKTYLQNYGVT